MKYSEAINIFFFMEKLILLTVSSEFATVFRGINQLTLPGNNGLGRSLRARVINCFVYH